MRRMQLRQRGFRQTPTEEVVEVLPVEEPTPAEKEKETIVDKVRKAIKKKVK